MKILIVEDEKEIAESILTFLKKSGNICEIASNLDNAAEKIELYSYDIIILDITLPDGNGLEIIPQLKNINSKTGVIILSAKNSLDDKLNGLDLGADDYMTKPFHLSELNSRVNAILRRKAFHGKNKITFNEISIDIGSRVVFVNNMLISLTKKEYDLLLYFIMNENEILTKENIAEHLWGDDIDLVDNFDFIYTHLNNLRKKIKSKNGKNYIQTVYGIGYKLKNK